MKKNYTLLNVFIFSFFIFQNYLFAQYKEDQDCFTTSKRILCVSSYTEPNGYKGTGNDAHEIPYKTETGKNAPGGVSCFPDKQAISGSAQPTAEIGSAWYYFIPDQSGNLRFTITSIGNENLDWVIYNLSNAPGYDPSNPKLSCSMIYQNNNLMMVACNDAPKNGPATTGATNAGTANQDNDPFSPPIYVNKGDFYVICINNFTGDNGFSIDLSASDNIFDTSSPTGDTSTAFITIGANQTHLNIRMNELIKCAEVDADGSCFQLVDSATNAVINSIIAASPVNCKGTTTTYSDSITITLKANAFPGIGTYYLKIKNGTDANTFSDLCANGNYAASDLTISKINYTGVIIGLPDLPENEKDVALFPNPSQGEVRFGFELFRTSNIRFAIYSASGQKIISKDLGIQNPGNMMETMDVSSLKDGVYYAQIITDTWSVTKKLILIR